MMPAMTLLSYDEQPTRYTLLGRLQNWDDQDSWKVFFDTYWRLIYAIARKSGLNDAEAQDVVQETVISVAKDIHKFRRDRSLGTFKGWLRNITRWRIADHLRKCGSVAGEPSTADEGGEPPAETAENSVPADSALEAVWEQEWQANLLAAALENIRRSVKEEHYQMFDYYVLQQWPVRKVARMLGVSVAQVYLVKHRISGLLRKEVRALEAQWEAV
jgi:RNA polymerase sigma factor (sigma-70 family)